MRAALSLLYVDDDPDIRTIVQMSLRLDPAIEVRTAASGAEALRLLADADWKPDVVVLDVMMPEMDGVETLKGLREHAHLRQVPAVFITAKGRDSDLANYKRLDATGIILKPFDPLCLAAQIRTIIGRKGERRG